MTTTCTSCDERPTTATLCQPCAVQLEDSLAALASWHEQPPAIHLGTLDQPQALSVLSVVVSADGRMGHPGGRLPSSIFDTTSSTAARGKTRALARELDVMRARQSRLGDMNGPRLAPDSKVWWPFEGGNGGKPLRRSRIDRIEQDLVAAVTTWIARLHQVNVAAPQSVATGHTLARGCTWLLWHVQDLAVHPLAAEAVSAFTSIVDKIERLVDRPADRVYVGPCWHVELVGYSTLDRTEYEAEIECQADLLAVPGAEYVNCRECGHIVQVKERQAWLSAHVGDMLATTTEVCGALARFGLDHVTAGVIRVWADRGELVSHGTRPYGPKRVLPLYRVDEVLALALAKPRRGQKAG